MHIDKWWPLAVAALFVLGLFAGTPGCSEEPRRFRRVSKSWIAGAYAVDVVRDTATGRCYALGLRLFAGGVLLDPDVPCGEAGP